MQTKLILLSVASAFFAATACNTDVAFDDESGGVCSSFLDEEAEGGAVTIRFVNEGAEDIYLAGSCDRVLYDIESVEDNDITELYDLSCTQTCSEAQDDSDFGCAGACQSVAFRVPAGGTFEVQWNGKGTQRVDMPEACWFDAQGETSCTQIVAADAGAYVASVTAYAGCESFDAAACECELDGQCNGGAVTGNTAEVSRVQFDYPTPNAVEVVFEPCAFGCAGNG